MTDAPAAPPPPSDAPASLALVEVDGLTFRYRRASEPAIRDVSLTVSAGESWSPVRRAAARAH